MELCSSTHLQPYSHTPIKGTLTAPTKEMLLLYLAWSKTMVVFFIVSFMGFIIKATLVF